MPLPQKWNRKRKAPPAGFEYIEPVLEALENEVRDKVKEVNAKQRKLESSWPVHQINWQKSRYVYDMHYTHNKIDKAVYRYCVDQKLVDAALIAKWKKPGYERLCSTYVINPSNYKFGTTSICRVPWYDRSEEQKHAKDPTTGCMGCASGKGAGPKNIFGNKYGQNLAAVQIAREKRMEEKLKRQQQQQQQQREQEKDEDDTEDDDSSTDHSDAGQRQRRQQREQHPKHDGEEETDDDDAETDDGGGDEDDSDYGPAPAAGIWAGSQKLQHESETIAYHDEYDDDDDDDDDETGDDEENDGEVDRPSKKFRAD